MATCSIHKPKVINAFTKMFGSTVNNGDIIRTHADELIRKRIKIKRALNAAKKIKDQHEFGKMKTELASIDKEIRKTSLDIDTAKLKTKAILALRDEFVSRVDALMQAGHGQFNPDIMMATMKHYLELRHGQFNGINDLDGYTINGMLEDVKEVFKKQDNTKDRGKLSWWQDQVIDPVMAMIEADKTGYAARFVEMTKDYLSDSASQSNRYKNQFKSHYNRLSTFISVSKYAYNVDEIDAITGKPIVTKSNEHRREGTLSNLVSLAHEILDGEVRNIIPSNVYVTSTDDKGNVTTVKSEEFEEDEVEYFKILSNVHKTHIYDGGRIQIYRNPQTNEEFYYIPIRKVLDNGEIVWRAYEVPPMNMVDDDGNVTKGVNFIPHRNQQVFNEWLDYFTSGLEGGLPSRKRRLVGNYKNKQGNDVEGAMKGGFYRSKDWKRLNGYVKNKDGGRRTIETQAYDKYELDESIDAQQDLPPEFYEFVSSIRGVYNEIYGEQVSRAIKANKNLHGIIAGATTSGEMTASMVDALIEDVSGLDVNNNTWVKDGQLVSAFKVLGERQDYGTWMFHEPDVINKMVKHVNIAEQNVKSSATKIISLKKRIEEGKATKKELILEKSLLAEREEMLVVAIDKMQVAIGMKDIHTTTPMNMQDTIKYAKSRSGLMNPMPEYNEDGIMTHAGRRKDFSVFTEYAEKAMGQVNQNELKINLLRSLVNIDKPTQEFLLDHTKATLGRRDAKAGLFGYQYGDDVAAEKITKILQPIMSPIKRDWEISADQLYRTLKIVGGIISGNLLGTGAALNNNWQRLSLFIEKNVDLEIKMDELLETNKGLDDEIAEEAGVIDVMISIGDTLLGSASNKMSSLSGLMNMRDMIILKASKSSKGFVSKARKNEMWMGWVNNATKDLNLNARQAEAKIDDVLDGVWHMTHGLINKKEGNKHFGPKEIEALKKKMSGIMTDSMVDQYISWGLGGGLMYNILKSSGADKVFAFTKVEEQMRKQAAMLGALLAWEAGKIPASEASKYGHPLKHPIAIAAARQMVYDTMFGLSPQFLSKMFRGAIGSTIFKFKPYQWHQMRAEWKYIDSWRKSMRGDAGGKAKSLARMLDPRKPALSRNEQRMKNFLMTRALISIMHVGGHGMPLLNGVYQMFLKAFMNITSLPMNSLVRGGESVLITSIMQNLYYMGALMDFWEDDEDEDKIYKDEMRLMLPMYLNVVIDMMSGDDWTRGLQVLSKPLAILAANIREVLD